MENNQPIQQSNSRSEYELKRQEKLQEQARSARKRALQRGMKYTGFIIATAAFMGGIGWYMTNQPKIPESEIISSNGLHWHPELSIYVKGIKQEVPANLGLLGIEMPIHTHDSSGVIHLEIGGLVQKSDITLGRFFKVWGKDIHSFGASMKMTVNGKENTEYENYLMQDKDKIELHYE